MREPLQPDRTVLKHQHARSYESSLLPFDSPNSSVPLEPQLIVPAVG